MKNIDKFGYLIVSMAWITYSIYISMLEKNAHTPIETSVLVCFSLIVLGCGAYWFTLKRSNVLIALAAGIFWPLVAIYFLFKYLVSTTIGIKQIFSKGFSASNMILLQSFPQLLQAGEQCGALARDVN